MSINWEDVLLNNVKESGIVDIIKNYKTMFEGCDIIVKYDYKWDNICKHKYLTEDFIEHHIKKIEWDILCQYQKLSPSFIERHIDKIYSIPDLNKKDLPKSIKDRIRYKNKMWRRQYIYNEPYFTESYIIANIDKVYWEFVSMKYDLSLDFIDKYSEFLNWRRLSYNNINFKVDFLIRHKYDIVWSSFRKNKFLTSKLKYEVLDIISKDVCCNCVSEQWYHVYLDVLQNIKKRNLMKIYKYIFGYNDYKISKRKIIDKIIGGR